MPAHLAAPARPDRARRAGFLVIALGVGMAAFAFVDGDQRGPRDRSPVVAVPSSSSSTATVLGVTVTTAAGPAASPASPATFTLDEERGTVTTAPPRRPVATTTSEGVDIGVPTSIVNTSSTTEATTTTEGPTTTTSQSTTSTTSTTPAAP
jgi:hypothetical protein